jgi:hypothetical protein
MFLQQVGVGGGCVLHGLTTMMDLGCGSGQSLPQELRVNV